MSNIKVQKKNWKVIEYFVPIKEKLNVDEKGFLTIEGVAINATITRNGVKYTQEELQMATQSLKNKPILKDHNNSVDAIIGRTTENCYYDFTRQALMFEGKIMDQATIEKIKDGRIANVSVGAKVSDLEKEEADGQNYVVAKGIEFVELSTVAVPGDPNATINQALEEAYKLMEEQKMNDIKEDVAKWNCKECNESFGTKAALQKHVDDKHDDSGDEDDPQGEEKLSLKAELAKAKAELDAIKASEKVAAEKLAEEAKMKKMKEEIKMEMSKEMQTTKGVVATESTSDVSENLVVENLGNGRVAIFEMRKSKGVR